jgi:hypothetical protein
MWSICVISSGSCDVNLCAAPPCLCTWLLALENTCACAAQEGFRCVVGFQVGGVCEAVAGVADSKWEQSLCPETACNSIATVLREYQPSCLLIELFSAFLLSPPSQAGGAWLEVCATERILLLDMAIGSVPGEQAGSVLGARVGLQLTRQVEGVAPAPAESTWSRSTWIVGLMLGCLLEPFRGPAHNHHRRALAATPTSPPAPLSRGGAHHPSQMTCPTSNC